MLAVVSPFILECPGSMFRRTSQRQRPLTNCIHMAEPFSQHLSFNAFTKLIEDLHYPHAHSEARSLPRVRCIYPLAIYSMQNPGLGHRTLIVIIRGI